MPICLAGLPATMAEGATCLVTTEQAPMMARDRHAPIVDAIERGDVAAALQVVEEHMAAAAEHFARVPDPA